MEDAHALAARLEADGVRFARVTFSDLHGKHRGKELPIAQLPSAAQGLGFCVASVMEGLDGVPLDLPGFAGDVGFPDVHAVPDLATCRRIPWLDDTVWLLAGLYEVDGSPHALDVRGALERVLAAYARQGLQVVAAPELEFYLVREDAFGRPEPYSDRAGRAYTVGARSDPDGVFRRIHGGVIGLGIGAGTANHEFSPGQYEINQHHGPALEAADHAGLLREAVKELAARDGLIATFMGKPFAEHEGSGLHLHLSLWRDGAPAFAGEDDHGASPLLRSFVAGVVAHAPALAAVANPTVNAAKRTVPGGIAPVVANWGWDNRFSYVRVPPERGDGSRVEVRGGDAAACVHLVLAATLAAGLDGIERQLEPGPPTAGISAPDAPETPLARGLEASLQALEADPVICAALGTQIVRTFAALKRYELDRFARAVTDWEWQEYGFRL